jgi:hypothetical protein
VEFLAAQMIICEARIGFGVACVEAELVVKPDHTGRNGRRQATQVSAPGDANPGLGRDGQHALLGGSKERRGLQRAGVRLLSVTCRRI